MIKKAIENNSYNFLLYEATAPMSDKHYNTIKLLTKDINENINDFKKILRTHKGFTSLAINEYRNKVRQRGRGYVSSIEINEAYNRGNIEKLRQLFSELLLEYIFVWEVDEMIEKIRKGKTSVNKIYENYINILEQNGTCRFLYLINR